jgi:hypothetical protein
MGDGSRRGIGTMDGDAEAVPTDGNFVGCSNGLFFYCASINEGPRTLIIIFNNAIFSIEAYHCMAGGNGWVGQMNQHTRVTTQSDLSRGEHEGSAKPVILE